MGNACPADFLLLAGVCIHIQISNEKNKDADDYCISVGGVQLEC